MKNFLGSVQKEFDLFQNDLTNYQKEVKRISQSFGLQNPMHLHDTELPTYWAGNIDDSKDKIAVIGINPKYDKEKIGFENSFRMKNWDCYKEFQNNFFRYYFKSPQQFSIPYYRHLAGAFTNSTFTEKTYYNYLHETVLNFDILPYHSVGFIKSKLSGEAQMYLKTRFFDETLPFILKTSNIKKLVIHDKRLCELLLEENFISDQNIVYRKITKKKGPVVYKKEIKGLEIYIFSRFIPMGGFSKQEVFNTIWN